MAAASGSKCSHQVQMQKKESDRFIGNDIDV